MTTRGVIIRQGDDGVLRDLVICSLEAWDDVWRRNQFLARELLMLEPALRILFVEPAVDVPLEITERRRWATGHGLRTLRDDTGGDHGAGRDVPGRLRSFQPTKWLPRVVGPIADELIVRGVCRAARQMGLDRPLLWVNDLSLAPLLQRTGWPALYDATDDWLLAKGTPRELARRRQNEQLLLDGAAAVTVCSAGLLESKGGLREVELIPNAVDLDHLRAVQPRPVDLPAGPVVCYLGTLHEDRLDVDLCIDLARKLDGAASVVLVGPDALQPESKRRLAAEPGIFALGPRAYSVIPAYLQHADVVIVPHLRTPFTESLDPIKAYECRAVGRPVVATDVAGFRGLAPPVVVAEPGEFAGAVLAALAAGPRPPALGPRPHDVASWRDRAGSMRDVLRSLTTSPACEDRR